MIADNLVLKLVILDQIGKSFIKFDLFFQFFVSLHIDFNPLKYKKWKFRMICRLVCSFKREGLMNFCPQN